MIFHRGLEACSFKELGFMMPWCESEIREILVLGEVSSEANLPSGIELPLSPIGILILFPPTFCKYWRGYEKKIRGTQKGMSSSLLT
jgi:hypothetical protein